PPSHPTPAPCRRRRRPPPFGRPRARRARSAARPPGGHLEADRARSQTARRSADPRLRSAAASTHPSRRPSGGPTGGRRAPMPTPLVSLCSRQSPPPQSQLERTTLLQTTQTETPYRATTPTQGGNMRTSMVGLAGFVVAVALIAPAIGIGGDD